jgi:hypothetical protein
VGVPTDVSGMDSGVSMVDTGALHTCAVKDGEAWCWGSNNHGKLGDGTSTFSAVPVQVQGIGEDVVAVVAAFNHSCALTVSGAVKCWGWNNLGQLGDGGACGTECDATGVTGLGSGVTSIDAGGHHTCVVLTSDGVKCWGENGLAQLGDGSTMNRTTPVDVSGLTGGVAAVSGGREHSCALMDSGSVKCWGNNGNGSVGDGTTGIAYTPVGVVGLTSGVDQVSAGHEHTCAAIDDQIKCWGSNIFSQIGDGTDVTPRLTPVDVVSVTKTTPTATFTPGPPTPTPTPCPSGPCALDFSIGVNAYGVDTDECSSAGPAMKCQIATGPPFDVNVYLNSVAPGTAYEGFQFQLDYTGVTPQSVNMFYWPSCSLTGTAYPPNQVLSGCAVGVGGAPSTYTGRMATARFSCSGSGTITLQHGNDKTLIATPDFLYEPEGTSESISINCIAPQALPGDTDGDGCPDMREQGINAMMGGARSFVNEWDFFDPTGDGVHRVDDITMVKMLYGMDEGMSPYYSDEVDRTLAGPNAWNLGPPDGMVRIADITHAVKSYGHDCL